MNVKKQTSRSYLYMPCIIVISQSSFRGINFITHCTDELLSFFYGLATVCHVFLVPFLAYKPCRAAIFGA